MSPLTWREVRAAATGRLASAGVANAAAEARWMVERASGYEGAEAEAGLDVEVTQRTLAHFDAMLERRVGGEPLQYVLGAWGFRTLDLLVDPRVLIPRPETEVVAGVAVAELERCRSEGALAPVAADLGTGSGAIGLSLAVECPAAEVWLTDRSPAAIEVASANLAGIGRAATRVRIAAGSWFDALPADLEGRIHVVVSNPPYVGEGEDLPAEVAGWEPAEALFAGPTGLDAVREVVAGAATWLAPGGAVVVEIAPHQADEVAGLAREAGLVDGEVLPDLSGRARLLRARRVRP